MFDRLKHLRDSTEDDVALALDRAMIDLPLTTPAELLELFNRMLDVRTGEDDAAEFQDELNIKGPASSYFTSRDQPS